MYSTLSESDFIQQYEECRSGEFSHEGLKLLYAELIQREDKDGEESEFDPEQIAGDFNECDYAAFMSEYGLELDEDDEYEDEFEEEEAIKALIEDFLNRKSAFCAFTDEGTVVYFYNFE